MTPRPHALYDPAFEHDACGVGFVAHIGAERSHQVLLDADRVLRNMSHRGATGGEPNTGDGAGILTALPVELLAKIARTELNIELPPPGRFAAGNIFLPRNAAERAHCKRTFERIVKEQGLRFLGWRSVPVDPDAADIGPTARASMPAIEQLLIESSPNIDQDELERQLYVIRKRAGTALRSDARLRESEQVYACTLSSRVIVYKGMLTPEQLFPFYPDLADWAYRSHVAMVHSRFSTNTFPSWDRAQPLRCMSHNGEINTLKGNVGSMNDRERVASSSLLGEALKKCSPIVEPFTSDSGNFDNVLELLLMTGRSLPHAMMMMVPEAWEKDESMSADKRAFYDYSSCFMEPWDGPSAITFTDGRFVGAVLDRNGLRPARYCVTEDDFVVLASETGVLPIDEERITTKGRLQPGKMLLIDFEEKRLIPDDEIKLSIAKARPYGQWLRAHRITLGEIPPSPQGHQGFDADSLVPRMQALGYTTETMQFFLLPMVSQGRDPVSSMGNDSALAVLSDQPRLLYDYFKQLFAQVTNPPIDPLREEIIMSLQCYCGPEGNLLEEEPEHAHRLSLPHPIVTNEELAALKSLGDHDDGKGYRGWRTKVIDVTWPRVRGAAGLEASLRRIALEAERAVDAGYQLIVLSDRRVGPKRVPISSLLATGAVHQHLCGVLKRTRVGLVVESGEAREVHHHCCLVGFGADAINPYLAFEALWQARRDGLLPHLDDDESVVKAYRKAVGKGMLKVLAKMGISTLHSYKGAQIFEAIGLNKQVMDRCFSGTASRIEGAGFDVLAEEAVRRHEIGYPTGGDSGFASPHLLVLPNDGQVHWRARGEKHMWSPYTIRKLQQASRGDSKAYWDFARRIDADDRSRCTLRGLLKFRSTTPIAVEEVEPAAEIVKRFVTGAMSYGSISKEAHESLALAMNTLGGKSNSGEGGEDPARYRPTASGAPNPRRSAIKQVASGRFGVTIHYLASADEIQIKIAQGAKPGEGGELPGHKVDDAIARVRYSTPGVGLISPPPHHDIYSIEDLAQLISDLKHANPSARISVKLVSEVGVGTVAAGVTKAHADHILISGHDGGTGASPLTSIKHAGLPWELGIAEAHQTLVLNDLRSRVVLQTDGQLKTGRDVVIAALLGAEEYGFSTAPLITLGCIMMRKCHLNTCPVGIATQDPDLRAKFQGQPEHVINYLFMVAEHARQLMAQLGFATMDEMIGRVEVLDVNHALHHWKAQGLDLSRLLMPAQKPRPEVGTFQTQNQQHGLERSLDNRLIELARPVLSGQGETPVRGELRIRNIHRSVGTMLSHEIAKRFAEDASLSDDTIRFHFRGTAGQSFGAWLARGVTLELEGDANDYVGKGLSGGRLIVYPDRRARFAADENLIVGNVALYGATSGEAFFRGRAAERFAVRNSGAVAVVEGVGDHGCEYMTGGRVVVLGGTGRNFAAGMSGGIAYVWDRASDFASRCNQESVVLQSLDQEAERRWLRLLLQRYVECTQSVAAQGVLERWEMVSRQFVRVMPLDYQRVLDERAQLATQAERGAA